MPKIVTSTELQKNTRSVIDWARTRDDAIIVATYGKPMVAILPFDEYQDYLGHKQRQRKVRVERFERLRQLAEQNAASSSLSEEEAAALIEEVRQEVYQLKQERAEGTSTPRRKSFGSYRPLTLPPNVGKNGEKRYFRPHLGGIRWLVVPQNPQRISAVVY